MNNLDDDDESFYSKHVGDYKLPPFPPLFDFHEDGYDGKIILLVVIQSSYDNLFRNCKGF